MADRKISGYKKYIPYGLLIAIFAYMAWIRTLPYSSVVSEDGVTFSANDPWYHIRTVEYLVENYPAVFPFDPWTNFPYGSTSSTGYGGLFDQIIATVALIVGLGDPSARQVELVAAFAPVFFGAATAIPVYLLAKKLTDRWVALLAPFSLALVGGQFLNRTTFSNVQHQAAEAFFVAVAVLGFVVAVERAYSEKPTVAHLKDFDLKPFSGAFIGAVGLALYLLTWPPAVYITVPLGLFVVVQMVRDHLNGRSTEYLALTSLFVFFPEVINTISRSGSKSRYSVHPSVYRREYPPAPDWSSITCAVFSSSSTSISSASLSRDVQAASLFVVTIRPVSCASDRIERARILNVPRSSVNDCVPKGDLTVTPAPSSSTTTSAAPFDSAVSERSVVA